MNKKKILALCLIVCMLAIAVVGGTLAYFTDTDEATNTFTSGNVAIDLTEAEVVKDDNPNSDTYGDLIPTGNRNDVGDENGNLDVYDYGKVYPGQKILKDPTITVDPDSELAYVAAKVIVTDGVGDLRNIIGVPGYDNLDIHKLVSGQEVSKKATQVNNWNNLPMVYETDTCVIYQAADGTKGEYVFYIFVKKAMAPGSSVVLFDTITINPAWDNAQMKELKELSIKVEAYATQEYGFANCFEAMTTAFPGAFKFS